VIAAFVDEGVVVNAQELAIMKVSLVAERDRILADLAVLEESTAQTAKDQSGDLSSYSSHMADQGSDAMEREKAFMFAGVKRRRLAEINLALERVESGTFGICESCGQPIPAKRLERMPGASLCIACKEQEEKSAGARS
jgi:RNA polymerase-binding transcription factor